MHLENCAAIHVLFTSLTENLRFCFSAEAGIVHNFEQKWASCSYKKSVHEALYVLTQLEATVVRE